MNIIRLLALFTVFFVASATSFAQEAANAPPEKESSEEPIYSKPTIENYSKLYWALSKFTKEDEKAVDSFILINQCDVYKKYSHDEFKWQKIKNSMEEYIRDNKNKFPLRFEFVLPLKLGQYDINKQRFEVIEDYQIKATRRFEVGATNRFSTICGLDTGKAEGKFPGYPDGLLVELSRPIDMKVLPVDPVTAKKYVDSITKKLEKIQGDPRYAEYRDTIRDTFVVLKIKIFSFRREIQLAQGPKLAEVMAILDRIEVYADYQRKILLFSEDYGMRRKKGDKENLLSANLPPFPMLLQKEPEKKPAAPVAAPTETPATKPEEKPAD